MLTCFIKLAGMKQSNCQAIMRRVVIGINFQAAAKTACCVGHVTTMIKGDAEIVMDQDKAGRERHCLFVVADGLIECAAVKMEVAKQMVGQHIFRINLQQTLKFTATFLAMSVALMHKRKNQTLIYKGIAKEHPAFRAELVLLGTGMSAARATNRTRIFHDCLH